MGEKKREEWEREVSWAFVSLNAHLENKLNIY